jgi:hypothetical protein
MQLLEGLVPVILDNDVVCFVELCSSGDPGTGELGEGAEEQTIKRFAENPHHDENEGAYDTPHYRRRKGNVE